MENSKKNINLFEHNGLSPNNFETIGCHIAQNFDGGKSDESSTVWCKILKWKILTDFQQFVNIFPIKIFHSVSYLPLINLWRTRKYISEAPALENHNILTNARGLALCHTTLIGASHPSCPQGGQWWWCEPACQADWNWRHWRRRRGRRFRHLACSHLLVAMPPRACHAIVESRVYIRSTLTWPT